MGVIKLFRMALVPLVILLSLPCAEARQAGQAEGSGAASRSNGRSTKPGSIPPSVFLTGIVVMDNGDSPPPGAVIQRNCGSQNKKEASVGPDGSFGFEIGGDQRHDFFSPDASQGAVGDPYSLDPLVPRGSSGTPEVESSLIFARLIGCELRAELQGYRSSSVKLDQIRAAGPVDVGTIVLFPAVRTQGTLASATGLLAPKKAKKSLEKARKAFRKEKLHEAEMESKAATEIYPRYAEAWAVLGSVHHRQGRLEDARAAFNKAIAADGLYVEPYVRLAQVEADEKKWQEGADISGQALALDPLTFPEAYLVNALANCHLNNLDLAEKSARRALQLGMERRIPRIHLVMAEVLARRQDKAGAIAEMRKYLKSAPKADDAAAVKAQIEKMESTP